MLPNFIIAGATRSGTTSLYYYLNQHPDISFPKLKEPRYFTMGELKLPQNGPGDFSVDKKLVTTLNQYKSLYKTINNKIVGDASSEYLYHHKISAPSIKNTLGDIPIVIILRNPVDRAFSAYNNLVRDGRENEIFEDALNREEERMQKNWDMMWHYKKVGMYSKQVQTYQQEFSNIKIIIFERFIKNPNKYLNEITDFLNIEYYDNFNTDDKYSQSGVTKNHLVSSLTSRRHWFTNGIRELVLSLIPRKYLEKLNETMLEQKTLSEETYKYLFDYFSEDITNLEKNIDSKIPEWDNNYKD